MDDLSSSVPEGVVAGQLCTCLEHEIRLPKTHLDMVKVCCILESRFIPVQVLHPSVQLRIVMSDSSCALEMPSVNWVITDGGGVQTDVCFCERITDEVVFALEKIIESTE